MSAAYTVLLADPNARIREMLATQLASTGCEIMQAADGDAAMRIISAQDVRVLITEMYLKTGEDECLIHAVRRSRKLRKTQLLAHTRHGTAEDREWARRSGADAYLIKPTRAERFRYVVARLATAKGTPTRTRTDDPVVRRDSLDSALAELESGKLRDATAIVFSRSWWVKVAAPRQAGYFARAKTVGVRLKSDSMLRGHFVEVRGNPSDRVLTSERVETPYRE